MTTMHGLEQEGGGRTLCGRAVARRPNWYGVWRATLDYDRVTCATCRGVVKRLPSPIDAELRAIIGQPRITREQVDRAERIWHAVEMLESLGIEPTRRLVLGVAGHLTSYRRAAAREFQSREAFVRVRADQILPWLLDDPDDRVDVPGPAPNEIRSAPKELLP